MGPATQALADAQAAKRAAGAKALKAGPQTGGDAPAAPVARTPRMPKADKPAAPPAAPKVAAGPPDAATPARKAKKPASGKTTA
jgi:sec-independent protein translocase protein TatB